MMVSTLLTVGFASSLLSMETDNDMNTGVSRFSVPDFPFKETRAKKIKIDKQKRQIDIHKNRSKGKGRYKDYDLSELFEYSIDIQRFLKVQNRL